MSSSLTRRDYFNSAVFETLGAILLHLASTLLDLSPSATFQPIEQVPLVPIVGGRRNVVCRARNVVLQLMMMRIVALTLLLNALGCYASHELAHDEAHDPAFAADWVVLSAFGWAGIATETVYRFHDDGEIEILDHREGTYFEGEAGQWFHYEDTIDEAPVCAFGDRWWSVGERLHVESDCTDGATRVLELEQLVGGSNAGSDQLFVVAPRGAVGFWVHDAIPGSIRRCDDDC